MLGLKRFLQTGAEEAAGQLEIGDASPMNERLSVSEDARIRWDYMLRDPAAAGRGGASSALPGSHPARAAASHEGR